VWWRGAREREGKTAMGRQSVGAVHSALCCCLVLSLQLLSQLPRVDSALRYRVAEEGPSDVRIGNVAADLGLSTSGIGTGDVTFALESGAEYFKIDNVTGELTTNSRRIDREKLPQCQMIFDENECFLDFEVSVIGPLQSWVDLFEGRVVVTDINDNTPSFPSPVLTLSVEENRPIGTLYLLPTATDRDFGRNGGDRSVFELQVADTPDGQKQPQLIVKGPLDREARDSYELMLRVRDGGSPPRSSQALLRVSITDVNDNNPRFERTVYEAEMAENTPPGTPVLQPLRRVTFSVASQPQDQCCYDSGVEDSETPSSKSSSGPRLGVLPLPEDSYERTTPEGSVGEEEHGTYAPTPSNHRPRSVWSSYVHSWPIKSDHTLLFPSPLDNHQVSQLQGHSWEDRDLVLNNY
uniref:Cadherin domain-containing protein n=1 Tax=Electrophorus electricus TaxID=8005 RepID=A0AAY5ES35_ELEEL